MILGVITAFYSLAGVIAPLVMGRLVDVSADAAEGYGSGFLILGIVMIVGALLALALVDPDRDATKLAAERLIRGAVKGWPLITPALSALARMPTRPTRGLSVPPQRRALPATTSLGCGA